MKKNKIDTKNLQGTIDMVEKIRKSMQEVPVLKPVSQPTQTRPVAEPTNTLQTLQNAVGKNSGLSLDTSLKSVALGKVSNPTNNTPDAQKLALKSSIAKENTNKPTTLDYYTRKDLEEERSNIRAKGQGMTSLESKRMREINKQLDADDKAKSTPKEKQDNYLVHRDRYNALMQNGRLANDIDTLVDVIYNNANQDATVSDEWADEYGAKNITGGLNKKNFIDQLSKRYELTPAELEDMALTRYSDKKAEEQAKEREGYNRFGKNHTVLGSGLSFLGTIGSSGEGLVNTALAGVTGDDRYTSRMFDTLKGGLREGVKKNIDSNIGKTAYDIGMGVGDMAAGAAVGSAPFVLAGNTANRELLNSIDKGIDPRQAALYAGLSGITDYVTNKIGLDKAKKLAIQSLKGNGALALKRAGIAGLGEAGENVLQDIAQTFLDEVINGEDSDLRMSYADKIANGASEEQAYKETFNEYLIERGISAATGFGMGAVMQGGESWLNSKRAKNQTEAVPRVGESPSLIADNTADTTTPHKVSNNNVERIAKYRESEYDLSAYDGQTTQINNIDNSDYQQIGLSDDTNRKNITSTVKDNIRKYNQKRGIDSDNKLNNDTIGEVIISTKGIRHGLNRLRNSRTLNLQLEALSNLPLYMKDAVLVNEASGMRKNADAANILIGMYDSGDSRAAVRMVINKYTGELEDVNVLNALISRKKEGVRGRAASHYSTSTPSTMSVADFMNIVKDYFPNDISGKVADYYGIKQGKSDIEGLKYTNYKGDAETSNGSGTNKVMAEDTGFHNDDEYRLEEEYRPDNGNYVSDGDYNFTEEFETKAPEEKVSKAYTNTGKYGGGWNDAEYTKYTDPSRYTYISKTEVNSVEDATQMRKTEGREAFKERVLAQEMLNGAEIDGLMMEWRETVEEARALESQGIDADKLWEESNRIFKKVQEQESHNAAALQALAKWSRNTPEGMLADAERIINKRGEQKKGLQKELDKLIKKHPEFEFSTEFTKNFLTEAEKLQGITDMDSREAKDIMANLGKMINAEVPVKLPDKVIAFLMDNMLGNFRTLISRNAGGNVGLNAMEQVATRPLAALIDMGVSKKTGKRAQLGMSKAAMLEYVNGFTKGLKDEAHDIKTGLHTARSGENTLENAIKSNRHVFKLNSPMDKVDSVIKNGLSVGDRPFYEAVYNQTKGDYNRLREAGKMGEIVQSLSDEDFEKYATLAAKLNGLAAVYQHDSQLSKAFLGFKESIGDLSEGAIGIDILSQFSMPFVKTPANVIDRLIDYSPVGIVRNTARTIKEGGISGENFDQARFVNETARNIIGTGLMAGATGLAKEGILSGSYSDDPEEKAAQKEDGFQEYALRIPSLNGGKPHYMDISWIPVLGTNAVAAAAAYDAYKNGDGNLVSNIGSGIKAGGQALFNQSMFQGMQRLFGTGESYNSDQNIIENMANVVKQGAGQAIPSLVKQIAQTTDKYERDLSNSNGGNYTLNSLYSAVPGVREAMLMPKVDTEGNLIEQNQGRSLGMKVLENMILPGKITEYSPSALSAEASRLSNETGNLVSFKPKADLKRLQKDMGKDMTNNEKVAYEQKFYSTLDDVGNAVVSNPLYQNSPSDIQEKMLGDAYSNIKSAINSEYTGKDVNGAAKAYEEAGGGEAGVKAVADYITQRTITSNAGLTNDSKFRSSVEEDLASGNYEEANQKLSDYEIMRNNGCNSATAAYFYDRQKTNNYNISPEEFAKTWTLMDTNGKQGVNQDEICNYMNKYKISYAEGLKLWNIYGDWKTKPKYENGVWKKSK